MTIISDYKQKVNVRGNTPRSRTVNYRVNNYNETFTRVPEYEQVKLTRTDDENSNLYDIWLYANSSYKELVDMKTVIFAPGTSQDVVFSGQYMRLQSRDNRPEELFMIVSDDKQYDTKLKAMVDECTETLRWYDEDGNLRSYPVVVMNSYRKGLNEDKNMILTNGQYIIGVPQNDETFKLQEGDEFIFNRKHKYRIAGFEDIESSTFMTITLDKYEENSEDDNLDLGIARYNSRPIFTISVDSNTVRMQPSSSTQIRYSLLDRDGVSSNKPVVYKSSDTNICTVSNTGLITSLSAGNAVISVSMENNPNVSLEISVVVSNTIPDNISYEISPSDRNIFRLSNTVYTIQKLNNGVPESETFTIETTSNTLTEGRFEFELIGSNQFRLKNNGTSGKLVLNIVPNSNVSEEFEATYEFKGSYG